MSISIGDPWLDHELFFLHVLTEISTITASVAVLTYNHEAFIRQCLDSILAQVVDFPYEIVIVDDCSTDSTQDILREYEKLYSHVRLHLNPENQGISRNNNLILSLCKGSYVAMLEGDDYWIDPNKLQRQVDFLNSNEDVGFVGGECLKLYPDGRLVQDHEMQTEGKWIKHGDVFKSAAKCPVVRTATLCFRRSIIIPYLAMTGAGNDTVLQAILAKHSHFAKWTLPTSVYRLGGVSNSKQSLQKELIYQGYVNTNRRLKHRLFPEDCPLAADYLSDRESNIRLKMAIKDRDWKRAMMIKSGFKLNKYREKPHVKFLLGPVSCFFLSLLIRRKYE